MTYRAYLIIGWMALVILGFMTLPVSRLAINPVSVEVVEDEVIVHRTFPLSTLGMDQPRISYHEIVSPITPGHNKGHPCTDSAGPFRYSGSEEVARWQIGEWASECLSDQYGFEWEACWTWHIGQVEMGPVCHRKKVFKGAKQ